MMDIINPVMANLAEGPAQMTDDSSLLTIMDHIIADDMTSDVVLMPILAECTENNLLLPLRPALHPAIRPLVMPG